jgi:midasin (ATPase involved in ribosome maturation)
MSLIPLIETPTTIRNLKHLATCLCEDTPLVLEGPAGAGKSSLFRDLARRTGNFDYVEIHLDDQMDSKTLFGTYVCTDVPGEFKWQPGALTQVRMTKFSIAGSLASLYQGQRSGDAVTFTFLSFAIAN